MDRASEKKNMIHSLIKQIAPITSNPHFFCKFSLTNIHSFDRIFYVNAGIAQLVERRIRNA